MRDDDEDDAADVDEALTGGSGGGSMGRIGAGGAEKRCCFCCCCCCCSSCCRAAMRSAKDRPETEGRLLLSLLDKEEICSANDAALGETGGDAAMWSANDLLPVGDAGPLPLLEVVFPPGTRNGCLPPRIACASKKPEATKFL